MDSLDYNKKLLNLMENAYGYPTSSNDDTNITYMQRKGSSSGGEVVVNVNAKSMDELHELLKLAGIDSGEAPQAEPEQQPGPCAAALADQQEPESDVSYSTDKEVLINILRDKLQKRLA
jgi:hypothetical protein